MSPFIAALVVVAAAPSDGHGTKPRLLNGTAMVTYQDYPLEALRYGKQGTVAVQLTVSPSGTVSSCLVTQSSGHQSLDERTCAIYRERAKFAPATDAAGRATQSAFTQRLTWKLEDSGPPRMPRTAWVARFTLARAADGSAVDCTIEAKGVPGMPSQCAIPEALQPTAGSDTKAVGFTMTENRFYPVDPNAAPAAPDVEGATMIAKQVSRITITPDGQVVACKGVAYSGEAATMQDTCNSAAQPWFETAPEGSGTMVGTFVQVAYVLSATDAKPVKDKASPQP